MPTALRILVVFATLLTPAAFSQNSAPTSRPKDHLLGTIVALDPGSQQIRVKEDKSETEYTVSLANTRTLLKVEPGAKTLNGAARIQTNELAVGDRVDVRGFKNETDPTAIAAASLILMSARDLQQAHQAEMDEWRRARAGTVVSVDSPGQKVNITVRSENGPKPITIETSPETHFTRYSPESPNSPVTSKLSDIQPGDQIRVVGKEAAGESTIAAQKIYSGSFQTFSGTVSALSPDEKAITIADLQTKQPVRIFITDQSVVRRLPPPVAMMLARRLNPGSAATQGGASETTNSAHGGSTPSGAKVGEANRAAVQDDRAQAQSGTSGDSGEAMAGGRGPGSRGGDLSQAIERLPKISISDLKPGDAVIVSAAPTADKSRLLATNVIAGAEPLLRSAPARQGRSAEGNWTLDMAIPQQ